MNNIADILVIVNPLARDQPAVAKAAALARWLGAGIELLICDTKVVREAHTEGALPPLSNANLNDNLDSLLEQIAEPLRDDGLDVETHLISGDPLHEAVIAWLQNSPADLLVKDTHHHSFANRAFAINTDWHLIRDCPLPLLLTKPKPWGSPPVLAAAVDPDHANDKAAVLDHRILDVTASLAKRLLAEVHVTHAYLPAGVVTDAERAVKRSRIKRMTDEYAVADAHLHVDAGIAAEYLPRMALTLHADIVVMGAISRSALRQAIIGSTAERVLESLPCDALVVKSADYAQILPF